MGFTQLSRLFSCCFLMGFAQTPTVAQEASLPLVSFGNERFDQSCDFSEGVEFFVDSSGSLDFGKVRNALFSPFSTADALGEIDLHNCQHNFWLRFRATGRPHPPDKWENAYLFFGNNHFVTLFFSKNRRDWKERKGGMAFHRETGRNEYLLLETAANDTTFFYARIANRPNPNFRLRAQLDSQQSHKIRESLAMHKNKGVIYFSIAVMAMWIFMVFFSLLQYWQNQERSYLYYALYVLSLAFGLLKIQEFVCRMPVFFSYFPAAFVYSEAIAAVLPHITYRLFVADITDLKKHLPGIARLFKWTIWFLLGYLVLDLLLEIFFFREAYCVPVYLAVRVLLGLVSVYCIVRMFSIRTEVARLVTWGTVVLYLGIVIGLFFALTTGFNFQGDKVNFVMGACTVEILIFSMALGRRSKIVTEERNRLEKDLLEAHTRIAEDLHDDLGSALSSIALNSQVAATASPGKMREALMRTGDEAREMTAKIRDLMWSLQPDSDSIENILSRMRQFSAPLFEDQNIEYQFETNDSTLRLQLDIATRRHFYLFFKEAVNNLAKYALATSVQIQIRQSPDGKLLSFEIADNGIGFDPDKVRRGHGLNNMASRASLLNGQMLLDTTLGHGTKIVLTFPI